MVDPTVPSKEFENKMKESETDLGFLLQLASGNNLREKHPCFNLRKSAKKLICNFIYSGSLNVKV